MSNRRFVAQLLSRRGRKPLFDALESLGQAGDARVALRDFAILLGP
jgi:hypothetical protein